MTRTIGVLGLIHDHVWRHLADLSARDDVRIAVADPNAPLLAKAREELGVERTYGDYADLLEREKPEAVLIMVDNAGKADLVELAASHGLPIMLEKPLTDRLANAERIVAAAERAGVPVMCQLADRLDPGGCATRSIWRRAARSGRSPASTSGAVTPDRAPSAAPITSATGSTTRRATARVPTSTTAATARASHGCCSAREVGAGDDRAAAPGRHRRG
ncbi:MAG: Gfo/Idh/MocA family oxidoreductase [Chloroflexia bacterium]